MSKLHISISILLVSNLLGKSPNGYLYLEDHTYNYVDYLINSGRLVPDFVLQQPYKYDDIFIDDLNKDTLFHYFKGYWDYFYSDKSTSIEFSIENNLHYSTKLMNMYRSFIGFHYNSENIILGNRTFVDKYYKYDPYYAGDLSEADHWIYGRVKDAYMNLSLDRFNFFMGRMKFNWGPVNTYSLIFSNNPYTYDQVHFSYSRNKFRLSLIFARLEDLKGVEYDTRDSVIINYSNSSKYISGHRLDLNLSDKFQIAFTEMAIYGGEDRDFELSYANPMTFYYGVQRNDRKQMSGLWSLDVFYKPKPKVTFYSQLLIDDIIVNNDPGVDDRARYPDRLGVLTSLRTGDWLLGGLNINVSFVRIWNRTYQSLRSWENYHYRGLSLGYPAVSCEEVKLKTDYWALFPFYFSNELIIGKYGNAKVTDMFYCNKEKFPIRPITNNIANIFSIQYFVNAKLKINFKYQYFRDSDHYLNKFFSKSNHILEIGINFALSQGLNL